VCYLCASPAEGLRGSGIVQGAAALLVQLVHLGTSTHQGNRALVAPIRRSIVQRSSAMGDGREKSHTGEENSIEFTE
jgi:hypothetical protein